MWEELIQIILILKHKKHHLRNSKNNKLEFNMKLKIQLGIKKFNFFTKKIKSQSII